IALVVGGIGVLLGGVAQATRGGSRPGRTAEEALRGLVPRLLAGDLRRRPPGSRRLHVRRRTKRGAGTAVRDPVGLGDCRDAAARDRALAGVPLADGGDRALPPADPRREAGRG